ncbi:hypothetical protein Tco_1214507 [Tanacetum coccineum]
MTSLEETGIFDDAYDDREGVEWCVCGEVLFVGQGVVGSVGCGGCMEFVWGCRGFVEVVGSWVVEKGTVRYGKSVGRKWGAEAKGEETTLRISIVFYINKQRRTNHKDYQNCLFACFLSQKEPKKVIQALTDLSWIEAMQEELLQFKLQKVWTLVDLPKGKRAN